MTWRCAVEEDITRFGVKIALADVTEHGGKLLQFEPVSQTDYQPNETLPDSAWLTLPRDAAIALMIQIQQALAPDRRSVDREVLERADETLKIERARVDRILQLVSARAGDVT